MRAFKTTYRDRNGKRQEARSWYVELKDRHGGVRRLPVMADERPKGDTPRQDDGVPGSTPQSSAEAKRLEARRRFLLGGAAALPVIFTVTELKAVETQTGGSVCLSLGGTFKPITGNPISGVCTT